MRTLLLTLVLHAGCFAEPPAPTPPLVIPEFSTASKEPVELRWNMAESAFPVNAGLQIGAQVRGVLALPATDPGRTLIQVELAFPLLARNSRTILLPAGTRLVGRVHLLRGELRFVAFESFLLPDGRSFGLPEGVFSLGPGRLLATQDGTYALLTVARPLRMEPFGPR